LREDTLNASDVCTAIAAMKRVIVEDFIVDCR
jgi:hypothetical protein